MRLLLIIFCAVTLASCAVRRGPAIGSQAWLREMDRRDQLEEQRQVYEIWGAPVPGVMGLNRFASGVGQTIRNTYQTLTGKPVLEAFLMMENRRSPDKRRLGINRLVQYELARRDPYTKRYMEIARNDSDFLVRATAIRALNRSRYAPATPVFIAALGDASELVRLEAAKALSNIPDSSAIAPLIAALTNPREDRDVRIMAAEALRHYRKTEVARVLVDQLQNREFGIAWQARRTLDRMTGRDFRYDEAAWSEHLENREDPFI